MTTLMNLTMTGEEERRILINPMHITDMSVNENYDTVIRLTTGFSHVVIESLEDCDWAFKESMK